MSRKIKLLVPPGIGDIHWVMLKMRAFLDALDAEAEVWMAEFEGRPRSLEYVRRVPFVTAGGYADVKRVTANPLFRECCYGKGTRNLAEKFHGFDYLLCFNGALVNGKRIETEILPELPVDWHYPVMETEDDRAWERAFADRIGPYALFFFSKHGMFQKWVRALTRDKIVSLLSAFRERFPGVAPVLTGAAWDRPFNDQILAGAPKGVVDMVGKTPLGPFLSMIRRAQAFLGFCGGNTIMSVHFGTPTLIWWSRHFPNPGFRTDWVEPCKIGTVYRPREVEKYTQEEILNTAAALMAGRPILAEDPQTSGTPQGPVERASAPK